MKNQLNPWIWGLIFLGAGGLAEDFQRVAANEIASLLEGAQKKVQLRATFRSFLNPALGEVDVATITASGFECEGLPLFTEPERSKAGRIGTLAIRMNDFVLSGLRCESLVVDIPDCRFDFGLAKREKKLRLSRSGEGPGQVRLKLDDLERFILKKFREIQKVDLSIDGRWIQVKGTGQFLLLQSDFYVKARLETDGKRLIFSDAIVRIGTETPTPEVQATLLRSLNPIIDFDEDLGLQGGIQAKKVELGDEEVKISGRVRIPSRTQ